ncbi:MAG: response regulator transcription factor [Alphaproteobacteria bacterium]
MSIKTIVLAEDDHKLRRLYSDYLDANGYNVMAAANGLEALSLLHRVQPRLVLLDIIMPDLNGIETCRRARSIIDFNTPIVFLSALDYADHLKEGLEAGGDDYILKTSKLEAILERVKFWTSPMARSKSERRRKKALKDVRAAVSSTATGSEQIKDEHDKQVEDLGVFLKRAISAAGSDFGGKPEHKLYFVGYVAGVVDFALGAKGSLQPQFLKYMRGALLSGGFLDKSEVVEIMKNLNRLTESKPVKNGWARGRHDKGAADTAGPDFVPNGLTELRSVA